MCVHTGLESSVIQIRCTSMPIYNTVLTLMTDCIRDFESHSGARENLLAEPFWRENL